MDCTRPWGLGRRDKKRQNKPTPRARLAMQEGEVNARTETRRGQRVARRLFQDPDQDRDQDQDQDHNHRHNNDVGSGAGRRYAGVEDNLTNRLSEETRKDLAKAEARWNFDFVNERPLPGRWDWVKVENGGNRDNGNSLNNEEEEEVEEGEETDQREKSETEANEKDDNKGRQD